MIGTVGGHAAVLVALVVVGFWKIDKLPVSDDRQITVAIAPEAPPPGGPPPGAKLKVQRETVVPKVKPVVPVQPTLAVEKPARAEPSGGPAGTGPTGGGGTNPDGEVGSTEVGAGSCGTPPCGATPAVVKPRVEHQVPVAATIVAPSVAAGLRIAGNEKIYPPDSVRVAMMHAGEDKLQGTVKLCVSATGAIDSVKLLKSTGYGAYDAELMREMQAWSYRPYRVSGKALPMCTVEVVIYRMAR